MVSLRGLRRTWERGLLTSAVLNRLRRVGLDFQPYVVYVEKPTVVANGSDRGYEAERVTEANLDYILDQFPAPLDAKQWRQRVNAGDIGMLSKNGTEMVGYSWASLEYFEGISVTPLFALSAHEAYLFDLYVCPEHRGHGVPLFLRRAMSAQLKRLARTDFYSFTLLFNVPARRFKQTVGATPLEIRLAGRLFASWSFDVRLRRHVASVPTRWCAMSGRSRRKRVPVNAG